MAERKKLEPKVEERGGLYFVEPTCEFFTSGCTLLDMALGGGWAHNRIINIVGDKSTGKTLLAIEAMANYAHLFPDADIVYAETESAFDKAYAHSIGMPVERVTFPTGMFTVEDFFRDLEKTIEKATGKPIKIVDAAPDGDDEDEESEEETPKKKAKKPAPKKSEVPVPTGKKTLYIVDSLDALSDSAEMAADVDAATYGASKPKQLSKLFRKLNQKLAWTNITVMIISQVRDNIGVTFGNKQTRSGGKALDFYASQVLWLTHIGRLSKTRQGVTRPYGVKVKAMLEKNKVGMPFRSCEFPIHFAFGIEDVVAGVEYLLEVKRHKEIFDSEADAEKFIKGIDKLSADEYIEERKNVTVAVKKVWREIETAFLPTRKKY